MRPIQVTKGSQQTKKTIPLPLEVLFRPEGRGAYDADKTYMTGEAGNIRFRFKESDVAKKYTFPIEDPWEMRDDFLEKTDSLSIKLRGMTELYGRFAEGEGDFTIPPDKYHRKQKTKTNRHILADEYAEWRSLIRAAMDLEMTKWPELSSRFSPQKTSMLCKPLTLEIEWHQGRPVGIVTCSGILQALVATLQIDALNGARYRFCACENCEKCFRVTRKGRKYCSDDCKHKQIVRNSRGGKKSKSKSTIKIPMENNNEHL